MIFSPAMSYNQPHPNPYNNQMYGRQESTMSVNSLDLAPSYTNEMRNMLETDLTGDDLLQYLDDPEFNDIPTEDQPHMDGQPSEKQLGPDYYHQQIQLQQAMYQDLNDTHYNYAGSDYSPNYDGRHQTFAEVKSEPDEEEYSGTYEKEQSPLPSTSRQMSTPRLPKKDALKALQEYKPQTKARGYKIKQEEEKADPSYKLKRARNNDAVRKSRTKAKEQQMERERELNYYKDKCNALDRENKALKTRLGKYEKL